MSDQPESGAPENCTRAGEYPRFALRDSRASSEAAGAEGIQSVALRSRARRRVTPRELPEFEGGSEAREVHLSGPERIPDRSCLQGIE